VELLVEASVKASVQLLVQVLMLAFANVKLLSEVDVSRCWRFRMLTFVDLCWRFRHFLMFSFLEVVIGCRSRMPKST